MKQNHSKWKYILYLGFVLILFSNTLSATDTTLNVYLIPGQGADDRLFRNIILDERYELRHINYTTPQQGTTLPEYAKTLAEQIDIRYPFVLIGVSLGGMLAVEMNEFLSPEKTIIISSAKNRNELPGSYRFQRKIPLYKIISARLTKFGAKIMQPIVEPDRKKEKAIFKSMLNDKDPNFLKRTIEMIMNWERINYNEKIIHIHGERDKTIPIRNVQYDYKIDKGSHMITLTQGAEINDLLLKILKDH